MKIERKESEFQPITITLETQDEVDQMFAMAKHCSFNYPKEEDIAYIIYHQLNEKVALHYSSESYVGFD